MSNFPAFPFEYHNQTRDYQKSFVSDRMLPPDASEQYSGLSARDYIAIKAMAALTPVYWEDFETYGSGVALNKCLCETAYEMADAMLAARKARP